MEVLKKLLPVLIIVLLLVGCEYIGFDGYLNQLEELGITHDLADAVTFNQHLSSRPREFRSKVYVLGTRGVFVMEADKLTSYQFYPFENAEQLDYYSDYWRDELPPINCYLRPEDGRIVITSLNQDQGLRYGDTLTLYEDPRRAVFQAVDPGWMNPPPPSTYLPAPSTLLNNGGITYHVVNDIFNNSQDTLDLILDSDNRTPVDSTMTAINEFVLNQSLRNSADGFSLMLVTQLGSTFYGPNPATLNLYYLTPVTSWGFGATVGSVFIPDFVDHDQYKWTTSDFYISGNLNVSTNDRYLLAWGDSFEDRETMLIYDYTTGSEVYRGDIPAANLNAELAESGMKIYTSSVRGGVARYDFD